jgi:hypothetical protein
MKVGTDTHTVQYTEVSKDTETGARVERILRV